MYGIAECLYLSVLACAISNFSLNLVFLSLWVLQGNIFFISGCFKHFLAKLRHRYILYVDINFLYVVLFNLGFIIFLYSIIFWSNFWSFDQNFDLLIQFFLYVSWSIQFDFLICWPSIWYANLNFDVLIRLSISWLVNLTFNLLIIHLISWLNFALLISYLLILFLIC